MQACLASRHTAQSTRIFAPDGRCVSCDPLLGGTRHRLPERMNTCSLRLLPGRLICYNTDEIGASMDARSAGKPGRQTRALFLCVTLPKGGGTGACRSCCG